MKNKSILIKKADEFAFLIYKISKNFPKEELYGLTSQLRRATLSVPLNVIEGFSRNNKKEYKRFLAISYGSLKESKYLLYFVNREKYINRKDYEKAIDLSEELAKMIWSAIQTIKNKQN
jgi:four helix bundle protein